ncbi:TPA: hypothetical protein U1320_002241, partial [Streptococcus suis]|nr:hypothetical protein [Streptococcus suis]
GHYSDYTQADSTDKTKYRWADRWAKIEVGARNYFRGYKNNEEIALPAYSNVGSFIQFYNKLTHPLPEANGKTFTISFEAISPNGDTVLHVYNANGGPQYFYFSAGTIGTATNAWKKFKVTVKPITQATYTSSTNSNRIEIYAPSKTGVKVRNIKVELGTVATDWSPAPEDVDENINSKADQALTQEQLNALNERANLLKTELDAKVA